MIPALLLSTFFLSTAEARTPQWLDGVKPARVPTRIVSLAPATTETLFAIGAGEFVVGNTRYCDKPAQAKSLPHVGGYVDVSLEAVFSLKPDLIVAMPSMGQRDALEKIVAAQIPVLVVFGDSFHEVIDQISALGTATARTAEATQVHNRLHKARARYQLLPQKKSRVVLVVGTDPIVVAGPGTFADEALSWIGFPSAVPRSSPAWPRWSLESLAVISPDVLVITEGEGAAKSLREQLKALPHPPLLLAPARPILQRPGPSIDDDVDVLLTLLRDVP